MQMMHFENEAISIFSVHAFDISFKQILKKYYSPDLLGLRVTLGEVI